MDKQEKIVSMFDQIAGTYDITNRVLSMGIDKSWRKTAINKVLNLYNKNSIEIIADVACGTGDMMMYWEKYTQNRGIVVDDIIGVDPSVGMTDIGKTKLPNLTFKIASATKLPFENESVDILSISYGIRNVMQRKEALAEFYRVLKPNGIVVILEFTKNESTGYLAKITDFYLSNILPKLGGFISKNKEAYTYLPDSIEDFTTTKKLTNELLESGFNIKEIKAFSFDISTMFIAQK